MPDDDLHLPLSVLTHYALYPPNDTADDDIDEALISDVAKRGVQQPLEIATDGVRGFLLDGNTRLEIARRLGIGALPVRIHSAIGGQIEDYDPPLEKTVSNWLRANAPRPPSND